jgi:flagellar M-ring protein FliF
MRTAARLGRENGTVEFFRQLWNGLREAWTKLSLSARINLGLAGAAVVVVILLVVFTAAKPQYVTLASDIDNQAANQITDTLGGAGIPYSLEDNNQTVRVPLASRSEAMLLLAENNLPVGRPTPPGFELFAESELMTNRWLQDMKFMRAIQGEIERQLTALDFVENAHVLIREAQEELFVNEQKPSEAAVTLQVTRPPTKRNIKGIVNMVAAAGGTNLHPGNITVTTTDGEVLHMPPSSEYASIANSKLEHVAELEHRAEQRIMDSLHDLGVQGTVRVSAQVNFDEQEVVSEEVSEGTEVSTLTSSTTTSSREALPEGAPGAFANVPEGAAAPGGTTTQEETSEELINFEPSVTTTRVKTHPGDVVKYTVALVVEGDSEETTADDGTVTSEYVGLTEERRQFYLDLVAGAVGDGTIPTVATVNDFPFDMGPMAQRQAALAEGAREETFRRVQEWSWTIGQMLLILFGFILVRIFLLRAIEKPVIEEEVEEVEEIPQATREDLRRQEVVTEITDLALESPETVAVLLRSWLTEEEQ